MVTTEHPTQDGGTRGFIQDDELTVEYWCKLVEKMDGSWRWQGGVKTERNWYTDGKALRLAQLITAAAERVAALVAEKTDSSASD